MNENILKKILENRTKFVPHVFTNRQIEIIEKYVCGLKLTKTEQTYFYSTIKKKIDALSLLNEEFYINGVMKFPERIEKAKGILKKTNKKSFISGSFLYSKNYNDIDLFIVSNKRKSFTKDNVHYVYLTEDDLRKPVFVSALKFSISNFLVSSDKPIIKRPSMNDIIMAYELAINEILDDDDQKMIRDLVFEYYINLKEELLDSYSLYEKSLEIKNMKKEKKIVLINSMIKEILLNIYSKKYLYNELGPFVKRIKKGIKEYPKANENLIIYENLLSEVKDECRRVKI